MALMGNPGEAGIGYFVVILGLYFVGSAGMLGLGLFELSRLFGFDARLRENSGLMGYRRHYLIKPRMRQGEPPVV